MSQLLTRILCSPSPQRPRRAHGRRTRVAARAPLLALVALALGLSSAGCGDDNPAPPTDIADANPPAPPDANATPDANTTPDAQPAIEFPGGASAAISLTYDDGLDSHLSLAIPALDQQGLHGTFFVSSFPGVDHDWALPNLDDPLSERHQAWRDAAQRGHELAGHTVFHPCSLELNPDQSPGFRLSDYDETRMATELTDSKDRLARLQESPIVSFAYPCESDRIGIGAAGTSYASLVDERFSYARGSTLGSADPQTVDLHSIPVTDTLGLTGDQLIALVEDAERDGTWLVLLFHGVGDEASCPNLDYAPDECVINYLVTAGDAHRALVEYLAANSDSVWTAPMGEVAQHIAAAK